MVVNTANCFIKLLNFHTNTLTDKLSAGYQGNYRKFGTKIVAGVVSMGNTENLTIWQDMTQWLHDCIPCVNSVQLHSKHGIVDRPSSEKPCVQYRSPHSFFMGKINILSSQQSLYVISQCEWWHITAWVMSYYCMSDVISLINTEKNLNAFKLSSNIFTKHIKQTQIQYIFKMIEKHFHKMITFSKTQII